MLFVSHTYPDKKVFMLCVLNSIFSFFFYVQRCVLNFNIGGGFINNEFIYIKARIDNKLNEALKKILDKCKLTQQDFLEQRIKEFVLENLNIILDNDKDKK